LGRRANIVSFTFSSAVTFSGFVGRPMAMPEHASIRVIIQAISNSGH
jgi:hypothetical protein